MKPVKYKYDRIPKAKFPGWKFFNQLGLKGWEVYSVYIPIPDNKKLKTIFHVRKKLTL